MRKAAGKRLPHGATTRIVLGALRDLHLATGVPRHVSRAELVAETGLLESTVDDRLRVLLKQGLIEKPLHQGKLSHGYYVPAVRKLTPAQESEALARRKAQEEFEAQAREARQRLEARQQRAAEQAADARRHIELQERQKAQEAQREKLAREQSGQQALSF